MTFKNLIAVVFTTVLCCGPNQYANATSVVAGSNGLSSPEIFIDFGADLFPSGTAITNQFAGVNFSAFPAWTYFTQSPGFVWDHVELGALQVRAQSQPLQIASISFEERVSDVLFNLRHAGSGVALTMSAYDSDGETLVETVTFNVTSSLDPVTPSFYGFTNSNFQYITLASASNLGVAVQFDNLQFNTVVPVPPAIWLFGSGIIGLIGIARRKKK